MFLTDFLNHAINVTLVFAPWLLLGLIMAGLLKAFVPQQMVGRWLGKPGVGPITVASVVGMPLPVCSCGVIPIALGLHRQGASKGSTISFMVATPQTGVDSLAVTYAIFGPIMTIVRPIASIISAIVAGLLAQLFSRGDASADTSHACSEPADSPCCESTPEPAAASCCGSPENQPPPSTDCCSSESTPAPETSGESCCSPTPPAATSQSEDCCAHNPIATTTAPSAMTRLREGMKYAFGKLLDDLKWWIAIGIVSAALIITFVPPDSLAEYGSGLGAMLLMLIVGIPMYVCASGSTPLAGSMMIAGLSPGTVLVFLLGGPATNIATVGLIRRELGMGALVGYLVGICVMAVACGYALDAMLHAWGWTIPIQLEDSAGLIPQWIAIGSTGTLLLFAIPRLRRYAYDG